MPEKKIIAVVGATGAQGGGLARAILNDPNSEFSVRALTRNPDSDKAKALADMGAEVVKADVDDVESLKKAFDGAYGAFCVTFFWDHLSAEKEKEEAKNMAEAAKAAGVKHAIWSTFEDVRDYVPLDSDQMPTLMEKYKVPHFDGKAEADHYFTDLGVPTTFLLTSFYWDNYIYFGLGPQKGPDGTLGITFPLGDKKMPGIWAEDIGKAAYGIFKDPSYIGKTVGVAGEHLSGQDMADTFGKVMGVEVKYNEVPADVYRSFDFPGADEMGNMFQFKRDFDEEYKAHRNLDETRKLNPELKTFEQWLTEHKDGIPMPE